MSKTALELEKLATICQNFGRLSCWQKDDRTWMCGIYYGGGKKHEWASGVTLLDALRRLVDSLGKPPVEESFEDLA